MLLRSHTKNMVTEHGCSNVPKYLNSSENIPFCGLCKDGPSFPIPDKQHYESLLARVHFEDDPTKIKQVKSCADHYAFQKKWVTEAHLKAKSRWSETFRQPWNQQLYNPEGNKKRNRKQ